jgi:hypothetical protein
MQTRHSKPAHHLRYSTPAGFAKTTAISIFIGLGDRVVNVGLNLSHRSSPGDRPTTRGRVGPMPYIQSVRILGLLTPDNRLSDASGFAEYDTLLLDVFLAIASNPKMVRHGQTAATLLFPMAESCSPGLPVPVSRMRNRQSRFITARARYAVPRLPSHRSRHTTGRPDPGEYRGCAAATR